MMRRNVRLGRSSRALAAIAGFGLAVGGAGEAAGQLDDCEFVVGDGMIEQDGNFFRITSFDDVAAITCNGMSIPSDWMGIFRHQDDIAFRFLAQITGNQATNIDGELIANLGTIYIVNPNGINFGGNATATADALYAVAGTMKLDDFIDGRDAFSLTGAVSVGTSATIEAAAAVHLLGRWVANHGTINVDPGGVVTMISGADVTIRTGGANGRIIVRMNLTGDELRGAPGVYNTGTVNAPGGQILLGASDLFALAIQNTGSLNAAGGSVNLRAEGGVISHDGSIVADDVNIESNDHIELGGETIADRLTVQAGADGSGNLSFLLGAELWADTMVLRAGEGSGDFDTSRIDFTNLAALRGTAGGPTSPSFFTWRQDASIDSADGPAPEVFQGGLDGMEYTIRSDGGSVTISDGEHVEDTGLRLFAGTEININDALDLEFLDATANLLGAGGVINLEGDVTTVGGQNYFSDVVLLDNVDLRSVGAGTILFDQTINGTFTLDLFTDGVIRFNGLVGNIDPLAALSTQGHTSADLGMVEINAGRITTIGLQHYLNAVELISDTTLDAGSDFDNGVRFDSTVNGANDLVLNAATTFGDRVGFDTRLTTLTVNGLTFIQTDFIRTTGLQDYVGAVTIGTDTTLDAGSNFLTGVNFRSTVNGPHALTLNAATTFGDRVGFTTALTRLTVNGRSRINTDFIVTTGLQDYNGDVMLEEDVTLRAGSDFVNGVNFRSNVDGAHDLILEAATTFGGEVGRNTALASLRADGIVQINGELIRTTGLQDYLHAVTLGNDTVLEAGGDFATGVRFRAALDGAHALTINAATTFEDRVGETSPLASMTINGLARIDTDRIETTGFQRYLDNVTIGGSGTTTLITDGDLITFGALLDAETDDGQSLLLESDVLFAGAVGSGSRLKDLTVEGQTQIDGGLVRTTRTQHYMDHVTLGDDAALSARTTTFDGEIRGQGNDLAVRTRTGEFNDRVRDIGEFQLDVRNATFNDRVSDIDRFEVDAVRTAAFNGRLDGIGDFLVDARTAAFEERVSGSGDFEVNARKTFFNGRISGFEQLTTDADGTTTIGSDISVMDLLQFNDRILLSDDVAFEVVRSNAAGMIFERTVREAGDNGRGDFTLRLAAAPGTDVRFRGDAGTGSNPLGAFLTDLAFDSGMGEDVGVLVFEGGDRQIHADGEVQFNLDTAGGIPTVATIGADSDLSIFAADFSMGRGQKLTVLGDARIELSNSTAVLSDISTLGDLFVQAQEIILLARRAGRVRGDQAGIFADDRGLDFVAGGRFFFSVVPTVNGRGIVLFANPTGEGDALGTLRGFSNVAFEGNINSATLFVDNTFLDLRGDGPTNTDVAESIAAAIPRESETTEVEQSVGLPAHLKDQLQERLQVGVRDLRSEEMSELITGRAVYFDAPEPSLVREYDPEYEPTVVSMRLQPELAEELVGEYGRVLETGGGDPDNVAVQIAARWGEYLASLGDEEATGEGFVEFLAGHGDDTTIAQLARLHRVRELFRLVGLTGYEITTPVGKLHSIFAGREMTLTEVIFWDAARAASEFDSTLEVSMN